MTAKAYLKQMSRLTALIKQKKEELRELREISRDIGQIRAMRYDGPTVQHCSDGHAPFEAAILKIAGTEEKIVEELERYSRERSEIIAKIQCLNNARHVDVLYKHYFQDRTLREIAAEMNYSYPHIVELHREALRELEKII